MIRKLDKESDDIKRLYKKLFDNSFYPATYNIETGMVEYPKVPNIFYFNNYV